MSLKISIHHKVLSAVAAAVVTLGTIPPAHAIFGVGDIVYDPANFAENALSAARSLIQIENQIRQLQNEAQMLLNQALNLEHLDFNSLDRLRGALATTKRLFDEAKGLSFQLQQAREVFAQLYPEAYGENVSFDQLLEDALTRWSHSREALSTAMALQAQATENIGENEAVLSDLIQHSQEAVGAMQAAQATNQLLALQSRQLMEAQQLAVSQSRAVALEHARVIAAEARSRELTRRFLTSETKYTPEAVRGVD